MSKSHDKRYTAAGLLICIVWIVLSTLGIVGKIQISTKASFLLTAIYDISLIAFVIYFIIKTKKGNFRDFGFRKFSWKMLGLGCGFLPLFYIFSGIYSWFLTKYVSEVRPQAEYLFPMFEQLNAPLVLFLVAVVIAPIAEEIFFRGFLINILQKLYGFEKSALLASFMFAGMHIIPSVVIPFFVLGYFFCMLYKRSKSLWPGIILHILINFLGFVGFLIVTALT